jgi:hypothetical protein
MDKVLMFCFHFDPSTGKFSLQALRIMQVGGVLTVLGVGLMVGLMIIRGRQIRGQPLLLRPGLGLGSVLKPPSSHTP